MSAAVDHRIGVYVWADVGDVGRLRGFGPIKVPAKRTEQSLLSRHLDWAIWVTGGFNSMSYAILTYPVCWGIILTVRLPFGNKLLSN